MAGALENRADCGLRQRRLGGIAKIKSFVGTPVGAVRKRGKLGMSSSEALELTILMPCLNEAETLVACIEKAKSFLHRCSVRGEIVLADNGSSDGSYGAALIHGIREARGTYVIMGDADASYDFLNLEPFLEKLRAGYDLVMGNRFKGGIAPGAMPFLHRYLGNPVLSWIGRLFFSVKVGDFQCGLRGFRKDRIDILGLNVTTMVFSTEMVVRAALEGLTIAEVPTTLVKDGRSRPPHLRTWFDGWRYLRFLLMFSPQWLFIYPGLVILATGITLSLLLFRGPYYITPRIALDAHSLIVGAAAILVGTQCISFGIIARRYGASRGFLPATMPMERWITLITLERTLVAAAVIFVGGLVGLGWCMAKWIAIGLGPLEYPGLIRILVLSTTAISLGLQLAFTAFLAKILEIDAK
jgi:hypothetical protein